MTWGSWLLFCAVRLTPAAPGSWIFGSRLTTTLFFSLFCSIRRLVLGPFLLLLCWRRMGARSLCFGQTSLDSVDLLFFSRSSLMGRDGSFRIRRLWLLEPGSIELSRPFSVRPYISVVETDILHHTGPGINNNTSSLFKQTNKKYIHDKDISEPSEQSGFWSSKNQLQIVALRKKVLKMLGSLAYHSQRAPVRNKEERPEASGSH